MSSTVFDELEFWMEEMGIIWDSYWWYYCKWLGCSELSSELAGLITIVTEAPW